jgi:transposase
MMDTAMEVPPVRETEVVEKAKRRLFSAAYKKRILEEVDRVTKPGEVGAILRREGLFSSYLAAWRRLREAGELSALSPRKRGPLTKPPDPNAKRVVELERSLAKTEARLRRAEGLLELQKKVSEILGVELPARDEEP